MIFQEMHTDMKAAMDNAVARAEALGHRLTNFRSVLTAQPKKRAECECCAGRVTVEATESGAFIRSPMLQEACR